jgi:Transposase DDE domain/Domain of unknown function (DUF4372)
MHIGSHIFAQLVEYIPRRAFSSYVATHKGDRYAKSMTCRDQFLVMLFGQLSYRESLRDTVTCLLAHTHKLHHLGFGSVMTLSTCARANERRSWKIYRDLVLKLSAVAQALYVGDTGLPDDLNARCFAVDASSIDVCLSLFPKLPFVSTKGALKLHLGLSLQGSIPAFFDMTSGKVHETKYMDALIYERGAFYIFDRGYIDYARLYRLHEAGSFFVIRAKVNTRFVRKYSREPDAGITCDQEGAIDNPAYPGTLRRVKYTDETDHTYVLLTNNMDIPSSYVGHLYKQRWQIELFFKWIKQHLKVKSFWGYSNNAAYTQICIALCTYLIVAIVKKRLHIQQDLYEMLQILSVSLFDKSDLAELFSKKTVVPEKLGAELTAPLFDF